MVDFKYRLKTNWVRFWMFFSGTSIPGKISTWAAGLLASPYYGRSYLANLYPKGFIAPNVKISHKLLNLGKNVCINDRVVIYQDVNGGPINIDNRVFIHNECIIQTGEGGCVTVGADTHLQPRCILSGYKSGIEIGRRVLIAPQCGFYPYDHGFESGKRIVDQPLKSKGGIIVEDDCWIGFNSTILDGVRIGEGAVIGAGSVVTNDIPQNAVAVGSPAKIIKKR